MSQESCNQTKNGDFCWNELMTPDPKKAKKFYSDLFGWETHDNEMTNGTYSLIMKDGKNICGGMMQTPKGQEKNIPPHWMSYINVTNLDETVKKAQILGASIKVPVTAAGNMGHFAIITDPTGATVGLWQSTKG